MAYGYDPSNPNTAIINGQYYVWQPSTAGADAQAYLGANADPALVNQDTSPDSGNGQWVPGTYDDPNGKFWSLLAKVVAATSGGEYALSSLLGGGAAAGAAGAAGAGGATPALTTTALGGSLPGLAGLSLPTPAAVAGSFAPALTTTALSGVPPGLGTASLAAPSTIAPLGGAGGSTLTKNIVDNGKNVVDNNTKDKVKTGSSALPSWLKPSIAAAAPTIGKLFGGGSSDLTNSLSSALTGLVPDLQKSFELGMQRQTQAQPLYDAVLKMALGRLPNWSTGGGE
jgi:hypothetical protein